MSLNGADMIREGVILAGGVGSRMGKPKFLLKLSGKYLIWYPAYCMVEAGVKKITVVVLSGYADFVKNALAEFDVKLQVVENPETWRENGWSFWLSKDHVNGDFVLSMADHVYSPEVVRRAVNFKLDGLLGAVCGDSSPRFVDIDEATKIAVDEFGRIKEIGKQVEKWNFVDMGVMVFRKEVFEKIESFVESKKKVSMSDIINFLSSSGEDVGVIRFSGERWADVDTPQDFELFISGERREILNLFQLR